MVTAFVLVGMVAGHSGNLVASLEKQQGVEAVHRVTGPYDVIAVLRGENINAISEMVANDVHLLPGVVRTTTCVSME